MSRGSLHPDLVGRADRSPPPDDLIATLNDLYDEHAEVVTLDRLGRCPTERSAAEIARILRRTGWLEPLRTRGTWSFTATFSPQHMGEFVELRAWLGANAALYRFDSPRRSWCSWRAARLSSHGTASPTGYGRPATRSEKTYCSMNCVTDRGRRGRKQHIS